MKKLLFNAFLSFLTVAAFAQDQGQFSGDLQLTTNFFMRDADIGAANTPQYDYQFSGIDSWTNIRYNQKGFFIGARFDGFYNSNLPNPQASYTDAGIGRWFAGKKMDKFEIMAGHIYDQIGTGISFRAYQERFLAIDNALVGVRLKYDLSDNWYVKGFAGKQKNQFALYEPVVKGGNIEGMINISEEPNIKIAPGIGVIQRTLDDATMNLIRGEVSTYGLDTFTPNYNVYVGSAYNTLYLGNFQWYVEAAYKSAEATKTPIDKTDGTIATELRQLAGSVLYSNLSYSVKGFGITIEGKRTENFDLRVSPLETLNRGQLTFIPPMQRQNTYRLTSRYNSATQFTGELAFQADVFYSPKRTLQFSANFANIMDLENTLLYREAYIDAKFKKPRKWTLITALQYQQYNQAVYEAKFGVPMVESIVPVIDFTYKIDRKKSIRTELQYQYTEQDFGQWAFVLVEFGLGSKWAFAVSDMANVVPKKSENIEHYYSFFASYTQKANKFSLSYVKQVEGIICTGGICRFEPAFSGVKFQVASTF